ncbi:aminotransferase class V-fold PLP-dependent enzyme [Antarcticibacterium flavum]|uniref:Aminotransferase class V-fold PLP-dependent enzyme n=1 Tax=Antarcticibacterium flavum TaxID=2058175 RepID=A0A5B7X0Z7_9FLAO|nr:MULTISPECIES: aminotransferase class V-fold PLP-dependent enzyme [Antarcticibacterium]MCM4160924.1 aminotransferase [Antarcticibacterium sp. W02-3]QCY68969.1 aminotransferase class V-fold PLP-dependent enzyme [Antarcticibacterium flavum]
MKNLRKPFPVLQQYVYLNTAASGLLSEKVFDFRQEHDLDFLVSASILKEKQGKLLAGVRETVGNFFNCAANRVALVPNFSYGFNTLLEGIEKGKKVLLLDEDYPSINWAVTSRDFEVNYAVIDENLEEHIETAFKANTPDVFAFSLVQYISGIKLPISFLSKLKQLYPETLFVADGTQFCGTEIFDFDASGLDVVITSTYKWLNAGYGNAFILFSESAPNKIAPKTSGFNSLQGKYKAQEGNFLGKFEPGHQDTLNYGSLKVALQLLKDVGMKVVEERVKNLAGEAKEEFTKMNLLEDRVVKRKIHSSIFNLQGDDKLFNQLRSNDIICSQRGEGIRVSFHYFNTEEELEELLRVLKGSV